MSNFQQQLEEEIQQHNDIHNQIVAGEEQIAGLKEERSRRLGRITLLQELAQQEQIQDLERASAGQPEPVDADEVS